MPKGRLTISGSRTPAKAKRRSDVTPPLAKSVGATMFNGGGRATHGDPPATVGAAMRQPGRKPAPGTVAPGSVPRVRNTMKQ